MAGKVEVLELFGVQRTHIVLLTPDAANRLWADYTIRPCEAPGCMGKCCGWWPVGPTANNLLLRRYGLS